MKTLYFALLSVVGAWLLAGQPAAAQSAASPGETTRNVFGPSPTDNANQCRGACGSGCPSSCEKTVRFECQGDAELRRVELFNCGTHEACRAHDNCLDSCVQNGTDSGNCQNQCDSTVMQRFGFENSASWLMGNGPYDGRINFEYTLDGPSAPEPVYHCPAGSARQCGSRPGCLTNDGANVDPVFSNYPAAADAMQVSNFKSGVACGDSVCQQTATINVNGQDSCAGGSCTRYGMEFDYANADPASPLECTVSTSGGGGNDFIGGLLKQGADAMVARGGGADQANNANEDGMAALLGVFSAVLASADAPEDVNVTITPLDSQGNPDPSRAVGSNVNSPPTVPSSVALSGKSGRLFVPMYQLRDNMSPGQVKERKIRCSHKGTPVVETVFRLEAV